MSVTHDFSVNFDLRPTTISLQPVTVVWTSSCYREIVTCLIPEVREFCQLWCSSHVYACTAGKFVCFRNVLLNAVYNQVGGLHTKPDPKPSKSIMFDRETCLELLFPKRKDIKRLLEDIFSLHFSFVFAHKSWHTWKRVEDQMGQRTTGRTWTWNETKLNKYKLLKEFQFLNSCLKSCLYFQKKNFFLILYIIDKLIRFLNVIIWILILIYFVLSIWENAYPILK